MYWFVFNRKAPVTSSSVSPLGVSAFLHHVRRQVMETPGPAEDLLLGSDQFLLTQTFPHTDKESKCREDITWGLSTVHHTYKVQSQASGGRCGSDRRAFPSDTTGFSQKLTSTEPCTENSIYNSWLCKTVTINTLPPLMKYGFTPIRVN